MDGHAVMERSVEIKKRKETKEVMPPEKQNAGVMMPPERPSVSVGVGRFLFDL